MILCSFFHILANISHNSLFCVLETEIQGAGRGLTIATFEFGGLSPGHVCGLRTVHVCVSRDLVASPRTEELKFQPLIAMYSYMMYVHQKKSAHLRMHLS